MFNRYSSLILNIDVFAIFWPETAFYTDNYNYLKINAALKDFFSKFCRPRVSFLNKIAPGYKRLPNPGLNVLKPEFTCMQNLIIEADHI